MELIDLDPVRAWMDGVGLGGGPIVDAAALGGGTQNIMVRFVRDGRTYVLRRGPKHLRPTSNGSMRREIRVLTALAPTDVRHPRIIAACDDEAVLDGAVFYLMEPVDGFNPGAEMPPVYAADASMRHALGLSAVDAAVVLGRQDHEALGLTDLGKLEGYLERQVSRWLRELDSYSTMPGYGGPEIPGLEPVAAWLEANRPASFEPGLTHGDYHLANIMFRRDVPEVAAIVDWEMCTVGDPLLDLGWLIATSPDGADFGTSSVLGAAGGLPTPDELVRRYAEQSTRDLSVMPWYVVLACFKLGIILEGTHARAAAGKAPKDIGDMLHASTLGLFARARRRAGV
jgi:aminoglycoside phosphotransferase (APT) family kinase protein